MSQQQAAKKEVDDFKPPALSFGLSAAALYACYVFYEMQKEGNQLAGLGVVWAAWMAAKQFYKGLRDQHKLSRYNKKRNRFKAKAALHGPSRWAKKEDLEEAGLLEKGKEHPIYLGRFEGREVAYSGTNSGNVFGMPGSGKSSVVFVNTILSLDASTKSKKATAPSVIINDPSAEQYAICHDYLRAVGYRVVVSSAWHRDISEIIGSEVKDVGLDPFSSVDPEKRPHTFRDDLKRAIMLIVPDAKPGTRTDPFFIKSGRKVLEWAALYLVYVGYSVTLQNILELVLDSTENLQARMTQCIEDIEAKWATAPEGERSSIELFLEKECTGLLSVMTSKDQWNGYIGTIHNASEQYDSEAVQEHIQGRVFNPKLLKHGKKPVALFVCFPSERIATHQQMLNSELTFLLESVVS